MVVTGGRGHLSTVSQYGKKGWIEDFSSGLRTGRRYHGCSSFLTKDNERVKLLQFDFEKTISMYLSIKSFKVLLVTGGTNYDYDPLTSTEVYRPSAGEWREVPGGALPRPMWGVRVVTLNNRVLLFGEKIILIC